MEITHYWSNTKLSRAALETMYFQGELIIHHKKGSVKYYDLADNYIPKEILNEPDPFPDDFEHMKWRTLRRIAGIGLMWNKPSDGWLNIMGLKAKERNEIFNQLLAEEKIIEISVENMKEKLYSISSDYGLLETVRQETKERIR